MIFSCHGAVIILRFPLRRRLGSASSSSSVVVTCCCVLILFAPVHYTLVILTSMRNMCGWVWHLIFVVKKKEKTAARLQ